MRMSSTVFVGLRLSRDLKGDALQKLHNIVRVSVFKKRTQVSCIGFMAVWARLRLLLHDSLGLRCLSSVQSRMIKGAKSTSF
jgi:hypothetical protein